MTLLDNRAQNALHPLTSKHDGQITNEITVRNHKSFDKDLNHAKSQIKSHEMKSIEPKSQIKSNHDVNQMTTVPDSLVYARNVINVHLT